MPKFTTNDGAQLSYTDEGSGQAVVLIAGYGMPATAWALQSDALLAAGFRVISFDRRSHGESENTAWGQRISRHGKDIDELLAVAGLDDAVLVGQSMGSSAIWAYVDLFGTAKVRGILTIDQTPKMINTDGWSFGFYGMDAANSGTFFIDGIPDTGRGLRVDQAQAGVLRLIERLGGPPAVRQANAPETVRLLRDHGFQDWRDVIGRLDIPFVMVAGRNSQLWPCEHAAASVGNNPNGESVIIEDAGHATNFDAPDEFNAVLLTFLRGL
jgi:non-heme chloroperoxidase